MTTWRPKCPRCDSRDVSAAPGLAEASDETFETTHKCDRCGCSFRVVPPVQQLTHEEARATS